MTIPDAAINLAAGRLRLEAGVDIQDATDTTLGNNLLTASDAVISSGAGESLSLNVDTLIANITGPGDLTVVEANGITLVDIETFDGNIDITTTAGDIAARRIVENDDDDSQDHVVTLVSAGAITDDNAGTLNVTAETLSLTAGGAIGATGGTNPLDIDVTTLTADTSGAAGSGVFINETDDVAIGAGDITTVGGDVEITAGGTISSVASADIVTTAAANTGNPSGAVRIVATGTAGIALSGAIDTSGAGDNGTATMAGDGGNVEISTNNAAVEVAAITASGGDGAGGNSDGGASGNISIEAGGTNSLTLVETVTALGGAGSGVGVDGADGILTLDSDTGGNVTQSMSIRSGGLELLGAGAVVLQNAGNQFDTLAGDVGNDISLVNAGGFVLDAVGGANDLRSTGNITLRAGGDVAQAGANGEVFAVGLELLGTGSFNLTESGNDIVVLAANLTGPTESLSFADADMLTVGIVNTAGISTRGGAVTLSAGSGLASSQDITTTAAPNSGAVSGAVNLDVTGIGNIALVGDVITTGSTRTATSATPAGDAGQVDITTFQGAVALAGVDASGGQHDGAAAGDDGGNAAAINVTVGDAGAAGDFDLVLNGLLDATAGSATGAATEGNSNTVTLVVDDDIVDGNGGGLNIAGAAANLTAAGQIGDLAGAGNGNVGLAPTDPLETAVSSLFVNNAVETAISNMAPAGLTITNLAPGGAAAGAALISNDGDLTVTAHSLTAGDSIGYVSTAGTLTIPDAPINVGVGRIRFESPVDVADAGDSDLSNNLFTASDFFFSSGTGESLNLNVDTLTAAITNPGNLTVAEVNGIDLIDVDTDDGDITVTAALGAIQIGSVEDIASANLVTLTATAGAIDNLDLPDGTANVSGDVIRLIAGAGGIGQSIVLEVAAASALDAITTADGSSISIDSIGALPARNINAVGAMAAGNVTLTSTATIDNNAATDGAANVIGNIIDLTADAGGIGQLFVLEVAAAMALDANTTTDGGSISIDSIGALPARDINAVGAMAAGDVTLTATTTIDNDAATDGTANVRGDIVDLAAMLGGIGQTIVLEVDAATALDADTSADSANIDIDSITDLPVRAVNAAAGDVTLTSTTTINNNAATDGAANVIGSIIDLTANLGGIGQNVAVEIDAATRLNAVTTADGSDISIDSISNLPVGNVNAIEGGVPNVAGMTEGVVTLNSTAAIDNATATDGVANIIAGEITLAATAGGIGQTNVLEVDASRALDADTTADSANINIDSISDLPVRAVNAAAGDVTLTSSTSINNNAATDGTANIIGGVIDLVANLGGIGQNVAVEIDAATRLNAVTTADGSDISIDSISNLPVGNVNAIEGGVPDVVGMTEGVVTLNSTAAIDNATATDGVANIIAGEITLAATAGGIGQTNVLEVDASRALDADTTADDGNISIDSITALPARAIHVLPAATSS